MEIRTVVDVQFCTVNSAGTMHRPAQPAPIITRVQHHPVQPKLMITSSRSLSKPSPSSVSPPVLPILNGAGSGGDATQLSDLSWLQQARVQFPASDDRLDPTKLKWCTEPLESSNSNLTRQPMSQLQAASATTSASRVHPRVTLPAPATIPDTIVPAKPDYTYSQLIFMAIEASPRKQLRVSAIYQWIAANFPQFCNPATNWRNSIRHNLSLHKAFVKLDALGGKSSLWTVDVQWREAMLRGLRKAGSGQGPNVGRLRQASSVPPPPVEQSEMQVDVEQEEKVSSVLQEPQVTECRVRRPRKSALVLRRTGEYTDELAATAAGWRAAALAAAGLYSPRQVPLATSQPQVAPTEEDKVQPAPPATDKVNTNTAPLYSASTDSGSETSETSSSSGGRRRQRSLTTAADMVAMATGSEPTRETDTESSESCNPFEMLLQAANAMLSNQHKPPARSSIPDHT